MLLSPLTNRDVFYRGSNGGLVSAEWSPTGGWTLFPLGGSIEVDPPANTALPEVTPTSPREGIVESASTGLWTDSPTSYAYQWERCNLSGGECVNILGAASQITLRLPVTWDTRCVWKSRHLMEVAPNRACLSRQLQSNLSLGCLQALPTVGGSMVFLVEVGRVLV